MGDEPTPQPLRLYGELSDKPHVEWAWVQQQLIAAGTYWVVPRGAGTAVHPHPRPVWGVFDDGQITLSIGSPVVRRQLDADPIVTVHLDSGTDVVIVEGVVTGSTTASSTIALYDAKYQWRYDVGQYGPLTVVAPVKVMAWRSGGWAGREGFQATSQWTFGQLDG